MNGYLLDTHVWVWMMQNAPLEVSTGFFTEVDEWLHQGLAYLSPISCWELGLLVDGKQLQLDKPIETLWSLHTDPDGFRIAELTPRILIKSTQPPGELHRDPADRILTTSAREYGLTMVTRDKSLLRYAKQGHLKARKP